MGQVTLRGIRKSYGKTDVIKGVDLDMSIYPVEGLEISMGLGYLDGVHKRFITGDGDPAVLKRAIATGAAALLRKPFNEQQLLETIEAPIK